MGELCRFSPVRDERPRSGHESGSFVIKKGIPRSVEKAQLLVNELIELVALLECDPVIRRSLGHLRRHGNSRHCADLAQGPQRDNVLYLSAVHEAGEGRG